MTGYWAPQAWVGDEVVADVRLVTEADRIVSLTAATPAQPGDERLSGLLLPGLANGHSHAFHRLLRGRTHDGGGTFWTWRRAMYDLAERLDPDRYLAVARAVYAEMTLAGYTAVGEFHYLHHPAAGRRYADPNAMSAAVAQAAVEAGIRLTLLDTCYLFGGLDDRGHRATDSVQGRFSDGSVAAWAERRLGWAAPQPATIRAGAAVHSVRAVSADQLTEVRAAVGVDTPLHVHLSEQPGENAAALAHYGRTPTALLATAGLLTATTTSVHATHLAPGDVAALAASGGTVCFCPTTERDLADGLGPAAELLAAGVPLSLGSDEHALIDPFEEMRALELDERLRSGRRGVIAPVALVTAGSVAGYRSLGWADGGVLRHGAAADFVVVATDSVRTVGGLAGQVAFTATAADVTDVVVGGRRVVCGGRHQLGSVPQLYRAALAGLADP